MGEKYYGIGERVAELRRLQGMSQPKLAAAANVSDSLVKAVEQGRVPASAGFVTAVAKALKVGNAELLGQPYPRTTTDESDVAAGIAIIRSELAAYDLPPYGMKPRPVAQVAVDVEGVRQARRATNFHKLSADLPSLLTETRSLVHTTTGRDQEKAFLLLCELYSSSRSLAHKLGYTDLATMAVERMGWAAEKSGSRLWIAHAQFHRASVLTSAGDWNTAMVYLENCRRDLEGALDSQDALVSWGGLHLQSGLAAARAGDRDTADSHLIEARETALRVGDQDFHDPVFAFGQANVGIWSVGLAVEMLDGTEAITRSRSVVIPDSTPKSRAGHYYIDLGRAYLLHGDRANTLASLQMAKKIAPVQTRYHPMVHETVRVLARQEARSTETLRGFAAWCNVTA